MSSVLVDILLMESYVNEKLPRIRTDSITPVKRQFYKEIFARHKIDSASFFTSFNYLQVHPKELMAVMHLVDSSLGKINPTDTSRKQGINIPKNIENLPNFKEQEAALQREYLKGTGVKIPQAKKQNNDDKK